MIKTINLTENVEQAVEVTGAAHLRIENRDGGTVYASKASGITAGGDGVVAIAEKSTKYIKNVAAYGEYDGEYSYKGTVYLKSSEDSIVEIESGDYFFRSENSGEGGGSAPVDAYTKAKTDELLAEKLNVDDVPDTMAEYGIDKTTVPTIESKVEGDSKTLGYIKSDNLFDAEAFCRAEGNSNYYTYLGDGEIATTNTIDMRATSDNAYSINLDAGTYIFSDIGSNIRIAVNGNEMNVNPITLTERSNVKIKIIEINKRFKPMLNAGTKALPYEPYTNPLSVDERLKALEAAILG